MDGRQWHQNQAPHPQGGRPSPPIPPPSPYYGQYQQPQGGYYGHQSPSYPPQYQQQQAYYPGYDHRANGQRSPHCYPPAHPSPQYAPGPHRTSPVSPVYNQYSPRYSPQPYPYPQQQQWAAPPMHMQQRPMYPPQQPQYAPLTPRDIQGQRAPAPTQQRPQPLMQQVPMHQPPMQQPLMQQPPMQQVPRSQPPQQQQMHQPAARQSAAQPVQQAAGQYAVQPRQQPAAPVPQPARQVPATQAMQQAAAPRPTAAQPTQQPAVSQPAAARAQPQYDSPAVRELRAPTSSFKPFEMQYTEFQKISLGDQGGDDEKVLIKRSHKLMTGDNSRQFVTFCQYNPLHVLNYEEIEKHEKQCIDKQIIEKLLAM